MAWDCAASPLLREMSVPVVLSRPGLVVAYVSNSDRGKQIPDSVQSDATLRVKWNGTAPHHTF